jgi:uncharacterized integral membrane protein (TIGR00698 family)
VPTRFAAGLSVIALVVAAGFACNRGVPSASPLLWAMGFGVLLAPFAHARPSTSAGIRLSATHLLRIGVALLGLRISVGELADVGVGGLGVVVGTIVSTMTLTTWLGRRLGVPRKLGLLIATGTAVCGASAIAAMDSAIGAREEDVGYAVATVTVFGTAAMLLLAPVSALLGLSPTRAGIWAGASIHEVAQATAAGAVVSVAALKIATLVKLCRVVMLAPIVAFVGARSGERTAARPRVPGFVLAFLVLVVVRSVVAVPQVVLHASTVASTTLLAAGLAALGLGIRTQALRAAGLRPLVLGVAAWAIAAATALGLIVLLA